MASKSGSSNAMSIDLERRHFSRRELRALGIVARGNQITRISSSSYRVKSQSSPLYYAVKGVGKGWSCDCPDFLKHGRGCKHTFSVQFWLRLPHIVGANGYQVSDIEMADRE